MTLTQVIAALYSPWLCIGSNSSQVRSDIYSVTILVYAAGKTSGERCMQFIICLTDGHRRSGSRFKAA